MRSWRYLQQKKLIVSFLFLCLTLQLRKMPCSNLLLWVAVSYICVSSMSERYSRQLSRRRSNCSWAWILAILKYQLKNTWVSRREARLRVIFIYYYCFFRGGSVSGTYYPLGKCNYPYEGNLCAACARGHAKFGSKLIFPNKILGGDYCTNCRNNPLYYIKFAGFFLLQLILILYSIYCQIGKSIISSIGAAKGMNQALLLKIHINFSQVMGIVFGYNYNWPQSVCSFHLIIDTL